MAKPISADYQTPFLLPPCLEDWVPANHPVRFIREFVNQLPWDELGFKAQPCLEGRPPYGNQMLLQVWLFAYLNKIRSSRALEKACHEQLSLLWLTGMNYPDHNTLWRFWRENRKALRNVFKQSVKVAVRSGLVGLVVQAIDGTKIEAACSGRSGWTKAQMEELESALEAELDRAEQALGEESNEPGPSYSLTPEMSNTAQLRQKIKEGLRQLEATDREHYHPADPEARRMKCEGRNRFAYNAQAVVDEQVGVITAAEVMNQENDVGLLVPMLERARENTGATAQYNVADSGYSTGQDLLAVEKTEFNVITPLITPAARQQPYHASRFTYDPGLNRLECPQRQTLHLERTRQRRNQIVQVFRCKKRDCPVRHFCTRDPKGRMVEVWESHQAQLAMRQKLRSETAQRALKRRRETVERSFAHIKQHFGFRRWTAAGLDQARTQWSMLCLTMNLQILLRSRPR